MDIKELLAKNEAELQKMVTEQREALRVMRFQVIQRQLKKVSDIGKTKKLIARLLTLIMTKRSAQDQLSSGPKT